MTFYICSNCNYGSGSWIGKCPDCGQWNTLVAAPEDDTGGGKSSRKRESIRPFASYPLTNIAKDKKHRTPTGIYELDRVLGGGVLTGETILLTGEPGIGKSTLLLQSLAKLHAVYVSGEESAQQVRDRAVRLSLNLSAILFSDEVQIESVTEGVKKMREKQPVDILVIDSIQTVYSRDVPSAAGSVAQLKECLNKLVSFAKKSGIPVIIIGHVTKEGDVAGPKTLEHLVDCVLVFEGDKQSYHRILRAQKNRFGSTDEIGMFRMDADGLREVDDPLAFIDKHEDVTVGRATVGLSEGKRPLFFEIQTLAVPTALAMPRRIVKGVDYNKVQLLLAVIRKHLGISIDTLDIYVNVVGGITIKSPAVDLGIVASVISAVRNIPVRPDMVFMGEVGLLGEVRQGLLEDRVEKEARRLKFGTIVSARTIRSITELKRILS